MKPLTGIRVLDFTHVLAGPFATRILGDMGADVVKVNSAARPGNTPNNSYWQMWNRNKRSLALDMSKPEARPLARQLAERADIVIDNFSAGVLDRWGIGYDVVSAVNAGVIYIQMSGMGSTGPWSKFVTFAPTIHALSGLTALTGVPGREDIGIGFSYNDHAAGLHSAVAMLAALQARRRTGRGQRIDMSQFEVGVNFNGPTLLDYFANGRVAQPVGNRLPYDVAAPHACYPCAAASTAFADERWVAIACMTDAQWTAFKGVMGHPDWANAPALATAAGRVTTMELLDARISEWTRTRDAADIMRRCQAAGVPAGVVQTGVDLVENDPQLKATGFLLPTDDAHPEFGPLWADRLPIRFDKTPCNDYPRPRKLGEDNAAVLGDWLGMDPADVARGEESGLLT